MDADDVVELEHAGWRSLCDGTAHEFYGRVMHDDGVMILAGGVSMSRDDVVTALRHAPPWSEYRIEDPVVTEVSPGVALLRYVGVAIGDGGHGLRARMTSVYTAADDEWRLRSYQQTVLD